MKRKSILWYIASFVIVIGITLYFQKSIPSSNSSVKKKETIEANKDTVTVFVLEDSVLHKLLLDTNSKARKLIDSLIIKNKAGSSFYKKQPIKPKAK